MALLWVSAALNYVDRLILTTMRNSLKEAIPMTDAQFGLLTTVFLVVYAVAGTSRRSTKLSPPAVPPLSQLWRSSTRSSRTALEANDSNQIASNWPGSRLICFTDLT